MTEKEKDILIDEIIDIARDSCNDGFNEHHALTEAEKLVERLVKKLNIDDVSERILLVRWMDGNPILDGAEYFADMDEALERYKEIPKFKNVEYTICKIRNAR